MSTLVRRPPLFALVVLGAFLAVGCKSPAKPTDTTEAPKITCPIAPTTVSLTGTSMPVSYGNPTVAGGKGPLSIGCVPVSGATFVVGTTAVTCSTTDALMRTDSCSFSVVVTVPTAQISLTKFVAFGDSITLGEDGQALSAFLEGREGLEGLRTPIPEQSLPLFVLPDAEQYPTQLRVQLASRYVLQASDIVVRNEGQRRKEPGDRDEIERFKQTITPYEAVLLMEGANQLGDIPDAIDGLRQMVQNAKGRGIRPYLATIPPEEEGITSPRRGSPAETMALNSQIRLLAASEGITLVDVERAFPPGSLIAQGLLGTDGLHPTGAGYTIVADAFFQSLRATLETSP